MKELLIVIGVILIFVLVGVAAMGILGVGYFSVASVETTRESPELIESQMPVQGGASPTTSTEPAPPGV